MLQEWQASSYLSGNNADYVEALFETYLQDPQQVNPAWRQYFQVLTAGQSDVSHAAIRAKFLQLAKQQYLSATESDSTLEKTQAQVAQLVHAYRSYGHRQAQTDPLKLMPRLAVPALELNYHGLAEVDLKQTFNTAGFNGTQEASLEQIIQELKTTYCSSIGFEFMHITNSERSLWLQQRIENNRGKGTLSPQARKRILEKLIAAEGLERYLGSKYVGQKRFSLEGGESLIPALDYLIQLAATSTIKEIVLGMAHRGRLNVLVNILGKSPKDLFEEFEGKNHVRERSGDVKYHMGFSSDLQVEDGNMHLALAFNPSHLEIVDPVVEGSVRARQERRQDKAQQQVLPVLIHGDAAFTGQGVVMETFNLSQTRGYSTGGTVHIVVNNQIGFTTSNPFDARSTVYCTDVAKMIEAPIFHVNGDDPEAVLFAIRLAFEYRQTFKHDAVIDLVCYRRHGHNEADEPAATQPVMYQAIKKQTPIAKSYTDYLIKTGICTAEEASDIAKSYRNKLDTGQTVVAISTDNAKDKFITDWTPYLNKVWDEPVTTCLEKKTLLKLASQLENLPDGMQLQPQVAKTIEERRKMTKGELPLNWGYAELLAYASLVSEGYPIRLSGQDSGRGTFAHRHAVLHDYLSGQVYIPLQHVSNQQAHFNVIDSVLSEEAVLAFEYGYATAEPNALVIWEAQFGDFFNGAQVVIDQFISSGEQKWGRLCGLVLLLPHGYEGAGPEHSSARPERFLQLCAEQNMQVCIPTTPAQCFHMLRRQMLRPYRKPLIVMTPKSLLRHRLAVSSLDDLATGSFQTVIPEIDTLKNSGIKRIVLCTGKVYYDLLEERRARKQEDIAIIRIEQLYPFPKQALMTVLKAYHKAKSVVWCQEEPQNQGAWFAIQHELLACLNQQQNLTYAGRAASAAPAVGYASLHQEQQAALVKQALTL
jgi:2-oxoglutarate dehydrogenase E1 component